MQDKHRRLSKLKVENLTSTNPAMARCLDLARAAAESDVPALVLGETGTGKTLLAQAIHNSSARSKGAFVSFNSSAISDTLLESQLFGHERGAFTGADRAMRGKFELADKGTLFLDEIGDMSPLAQAKILRAVEYGEFERLGSEQMRGSNARIIAATNRNLVQRIRERTFREDLYHRLSGLTLRIPALRERVEELPALIASELKAVAAEAGKSITAIDPEAMDKLLQHHWRGNLRELNHTMRTVVLFCKGEVVLPEHVTFASELSPDLSTVAADRRPENDGAAPPEGRPSRDGEDLALSRVVKRHIRAVYQRANGNQRRTARLLGISRSTLVRHLQNMDLK